MIGGKTVVYTSGTSSIEKVLSTNFNLKSKTGVVILSNTKGQIIQKLDYDNLSNGIALIKQGNNYLENNAISPGYQNTVDGIKSFQKKYLSTPKDLIISEDDIIDEKKKIENFRKIILGFDYFEKIYDKFKKTKNKIDNLDDITNLLENEENIKEIDKILNKFNKKNIYYNIEENFFGREL